MRIAFLFPNLNLTSGGGAPLTFHLTASGLSHLGHEVSVICVELLPDQVPADTPYRVHALGWRTGTRRERLRRLAKLMHTWEDRVDLFHIFDGRLAPAGGLYRSEGGRAPVVATLNNYHLFCGDVDLMDGACHRTCNAFKRVLHSPYSLARGMLALPGRIEEQLVGFKYVDSIDHFLPNSPATQQIYAEAGFDMRRSTVVPALIDYERLRAVADAVPQAAAPAGEPWDVLFAGRLTTAKGVDILLEALPRIQAPVRLHVAGDGPELAGLRARAAALGIEDRVRFLGWVPNRDLWRVLRGMHAFVHPGRWPEPCGRTVQEALALGVPTVVSDVGGPPWLVGPHGRTFRPGDADDLARRLDGMFGAYGTAREAAAAGVARAAEFDYRRSVPRIVDVYCQLGAPTLSV